MTVVKSLRTGEQDAEFRQLWSYFYAQVSTGKARTGVFTGCVVSATSPSPSGSVVIGTGLAVCQPTTAGGAFPFLVSVAETVDVFTANPMQFVSNPRIDIVGIDQTTGNSSVLVGTPNALPSPPTVPSTFVPLAQLTHAAGATTIPSSAIADLRQSVGLAGATVFVSGAAERDRLVKYSGLRVWRTDLNRDEVWDGTGWFTRVSGFGSTVSTNASGDFSFVVPNLSTVKVWIPYNGNGQAVSPGKANIVFGRNANSYSGNTVTARVWAGQTGTGVASAVTVTIDWVAEGYA